MKRIIGAVLAAVCVFGAQGERTISLNSGDGAASWQLFRQRDVLGKSGTVISTPGYSYPGAIEGIVPGTTFAAYVAAGREENPEWGDNIYNVDESWYNVPFWYRAEFESPAVGEGERVWLHFDNTHRYADFFFNGVKLSGDGSAALRSVKGHMVRSRYDITDLLKADGMNAVAVLITDPNQKKKRDSSDAYGLGSSPSYMSAAGWDWMPYVPGRLAGITGKAYLRVTGDAIIDNPWVRGLLPEAGRGEVKVKATLKNSSADARLLTLRGTITPGDISFEKSVTVEGGGEAEVSVGPDDFPSLNIANPRLWWPNGYGEPNLYTCTLEAVADGTVTDTRRIDFGIRDYEWKEMTNSEGYPVWQLYVNGVRVYVKGGNWGISEYLLRCHGEEYETKIKLHKEMNYNMIRLWTGCVTDEEFYDYCDRHGIMVWDDFWIYVSFFGVSEPDVFKLNAREKVLRLRNHPCIAMWCGANETHPADDLDTYLRELVAEADGGDRMYKSCSNDEGLSGSGWWSNQTPDRYFESASNALGFAGYRFTDTSGYGMRTEIGMGTFPNYESVIEFIPEESRWPLPDDETLKNVDNTVWNHHFFGKEGGNASPADYRNSVNSQYGESQGLEEFCEKSQLLNIECMKGMYEAWNDKLWNDATGLLLWMSNPAYPSFLWQTYDYYYDTTGAYWGAKSACEHRHIQWNSRTGSVKVINTSGEALEGATATAAIYDIAGNELTECRRSAAVSVAASDKTELFTLDTRGDAAPGIRFVCLTLTGADGTELSRNVYWHNNDSRYSYSALTLLPEAEVACEIVPDAAAGEGHYLLTLENRSDAVAFANRIRLVNPVSGERILPAVMSDNFITLMPRESRTITVEAPVAQLADGADVLVKQFRKDEFRGAATDGAGIDTPDVRPQAVTVGTPGGCGLILGWADGSERHVRVHNMQGVQVMERRVKSMELLQLPAQGFYVVRVGDEVLKVLVK